jgi:hypothetical protein
VNGIELLGKLPLVFTLLGMPCWSKTGRRHEHKPLIFKDNFLVCTFWPNLSVFSSQLLKVLPTIYINWDIAVLRPFINSDSDLKSTVIKQDSDMTAGWVTL